MVVAGNLEESDTSFDPVYDKVASEFILLSKEWC